MGGGAVRPDWRAVPRRAHCRLTVDPAPAVTTQALGEVVVTEDLGLGQVVKLLPDGGMAVAFESGEEEVYTPDDTRFVHANAGRKSRRGSHRRERGPMAQ